MTSPLVACLFAAGFSDAGSALGCSLSGLTSILGVLFMYSVSSLDISSVNLRTFSQISSV